MINPLTSFLKLNIAQICLRISHKKIFAEKYGKKATLGLLILYQTAISSLNKATHETGINEHFKALSLWLIGDLLKPLHAQLHLSDASYLSHTISMCCPSDQYIKQPIPQTA